MSESSTVSSSSSAFNSSTRVNANTSRRKSSASSSFKASEIIENILNDACAHIDDRKRNPEDFKLSARHKIELNELLTNLRTYHCTIETLEKKRNSIDICDPKCKNIDFNKSIHTTKQKLISTIISYIDKMAEIFSSISQKYRQRLCRIIVKVQKYGCHGLVEPFVLINEISYIQHFIQTINDARLASQNDISEMSSFSLFDGQCCEKDNKINNKEMCADACTEQKEAILNKMINFLSMIDLDTSFSSPFCPNFLHVFNAICSVILIINDFSTRSLKNN